MTVLAKIATLSIRETEFYETIFLVIERLEIPKALVLLEGSGLCIHRILAAMMRTKQIAKIIDQSQAQNILAVARMHEIAADTDLIHLLCLTFGLIGIELFVSL